MKICRLIGFVILSCLMFTSCSDDSLSVEKIEEEIFSRVKFTKSYDTYTCTYNFTSTLSEVFSPDSFQYGVEFGTDSNFEWYVYLEDSNLSSFSMTLFLAAEEDWATMEFYMISFKSLEAKLASVGYLNAEERAFYNNLKKELNRFLQKGFISRAYVEYDQVKYYLE